MTSKQSETLLFIHNYWKEHGYAPSFQDIMDHLKLSSKSGVHRLLTALKKRGKVTFIPNHARSVQVVDIPESLINTDPRKKKAYKDREITIQELLYMVDDPLFYKKRNPLHVNIVRNNVKKLFGEKNV